MTKKSKKQRKASKERQAKRREKRKEIKVGSLQELPSAITEAEKLEHQLQLPEPTGLASAPPPMTTVATPEPQVDETYEAMVADVGIVKEPEPTPAFDAQKLIDDLLKRQ